MKKKPSNSVKHEECCVKSEEEEKKERIDEDKLRMLLAEYQACQDMRNFYSTAAWQIGAILIGGAMVALSIGFKEKLPFTRMVALDMFAIFAIIMWLLSARRHHPFIRLHDERLRQIEEELCHMKQHLLCEELFKKGGVCIMRKCKNIPITVPGPRHYTLLTILGCGFIILIFISLALVYYKII
jgi:hypothetical protein